jgi:putative transposase
MPTNLHRYYGARCLHFITTSCYQRRARLGAPQNRDLFLEVMEQVRRRYRFVLIGYVVMPQHVHLLFSELDHGDPSLVMKALKPSFARRLLEGIRALLTPEHRASGRPPHRGSGLATSPSPISLG